MEISWVAILFVWIVNRERFHILIIISVLNLRSISSCPSGYYSNTNGICVVCPPGTFSNNCSDRCPNGRYGLRCAYACSCADCDPVSGCLVLDSTSEPMTTTPLSTDATSNVFQIDVHLILLIVILVIVAGNLAVSLFRRCYIKRRFARPSHEEKAKRESTTQGTIEETEMNQGAYESPIIPTERQDIRVYTELN